MTETVNVLTEAADTAAVVETDDAKVIAETGSDEAQEQEDKPAKSFTQDELNAKLAKQRAITERRYAKRFDALQSELNELKAAQKSAGEKAAAGTETAKAPQRADFESYEDYIGAKARFDAGEEIRKEIAALKQEREKEAVSQKEVAAQEKLAKAADTRVRDGRKEFPDFDEVVREAFEDGVVEPQSELYFGIIDSPVGHRIIMHLAKNPELAEKINEMSPRGIHRELGKLEDKFSKKPEAKKIEIMEPLNGHGRTPKQNDPMREDISMDEYVRLRNAQEHKRRQGV